MQSKFKFIFILLLYLYFFFSPHNIYALDISNISVNRDIIPKYDKLEITFDINNTVATNLQLPYDPNAPHGLNSDLDDFNAINGITVDLEIEDPNGRKFLQPAFYYVYYEDDIKNNNFWAYPTGLNTWMARFSPNMIGNWRYRIHAKDNSGTALSTWQNFNVIESDNKGFIKVSDQDARYFEFDNKQPFWGNQAYTSINLEDEDTLSTISDNGGEFLRIWLTSLNIYGSAWNPYYEKMNRYGGYIPRTGLISFTMPDNHKQVVMTIDSANDDSWFSACRVTGIWGQHQPVKRNTDYQIKVRYIGNDISGPKVTGYDYGFVIKPNLRWDADCSASDPTSVISNYGKNSEAGQESIIEGIWNSGNRNFAPAIYYALENANSGRVHILSFSMREKYANGSYGPNILIKDSMQYHLYYGQYGSHIFDKKLELAEKYNMYIKLVIQEKGDDIFSKLGYEGDWVNRDNGNYFYVGRRQNKTMWLYKAWWRYLQARWGYSPSIHSWELVNEGDPRSVDHYRLADELGKYMHCGVFGINTEAVDGIRCDSDHPNDHLVTTSFWHSFPVDNFWANGRYPNIDYADFHAYNSTGWLDDIAHESDTALYHLDYSKYTRDNFQNATKINNTQSMPIVRGEAGIDPVRGPQQEIGDMALDIKGVWLHNYLWSRLDYGGVYELYWWKNNAIKNLGLDNLAGLYEHFKYFKDFVNNIPINNGNYQDVQAEVSDVNIRVVGQKDIINNNAFLWVQNINHNWRNVVDNINISPVSGNIIISGFAHDSDYLLEYWNLYGNGLVSTQSINSDYNGILSVNINNLTDDIGIKIGVFNNNPIAIGDFNNDAVVDVSDLMVVLNQWGNYGISEILSVLNNWGTIY